MTFLSLLSLVGERYKMQEHRLPKHRLPKHRLRKGILTILCIKNARFFCMQFISLNYHVTH